jgi:ABC-2 type transport system ATP-binding protein
MSNDSAIHLSGINKSFKLPQEKNTSVKNIIIHPFKKRRTVKQDVLKGIDLDIKKGEFFGIVGRNGSGKSTLLKLLAGIYTPDAGNLTVNGKLTPFIELGVGFNQELTGRENVFLNGALLGFSRKEMLEMYDDIVDFAELEKFMDQRLKNYSSGMQVRLAFSIAIKAQSDILLLDEVLAVGDMAFQKKCFGYFRELKKEKKTTVFISHDMSAIREYCDRAALIEKGKIVSIGDPNKISQKYLKVFEKKKSDSSIPKNRWGNGDIQISNVSAKKNKKNLVLEVHYKVNKSVNNPILGVRIISPVGLTIFESNTKWQELKTGLFSPGSDNSVKWDIPDIFTDGVHEVTAAVTDSDGLQVFDWWESATTIDISKEIQTSAVTLPYHSVIMSKKDKKNV